MTATRQRVGAYALIEESGRVLLCRMSSRTPTPGRLTLPGGGLRHGEWPEQAALRELYEETGLRGEIAEFAGVHCNLYTGGNGDSIHGIRFIYRVRVALTELRTESDDTTDGSAWLPIESTTGLDLSEHARYAISNYG